MNRLAFWNRNTALVSKHLRPFQHQPKRRKAGPRRNDVPSLCLDNRLGSSMYKQHLDGVT